MARRTDSMSDFIGKVLGQNYRIVEPIGFGAMGMVFVVEHIALKKRFAAKLLTADLARHPEAIARFEVEAHAASQLDHENIVSVIDYGKTDDGCVFLIMELLRGKTLQARMDQGRATADEVVSIMTQVCRALAAAHSAGIVHRDMKPENIFLTQRPGGRLVVKVLDFGISKAARESSLRDGRITKQGQLLGSPEYMSPEASRGDEVDPRADIYAVGIMLYELLCGEVPFRHENYLKVLQMHAGQAPRPPRQLAPDLTEEVEQLILRALEKDPRRRQSSAEELEAELLAAMPDVAQRVLHQSQTPSVPWLTSSTNPGIRLSGPLPSMSEGTGTSHARPAPGDNTTMVTRSRGRRGLVLALWTMITIVSAGAAALVILRWSREPGDGGREASAAPAPALAVAGDNPSPTAAKAEAAPAADTVVAPAGEADSRAEPTEAGMAAPEAEAGTAASDPAGEADGAQPIAEDPKAPAEAAAAGTVEPDPTGAARPAQVDRVVDRDSPTEAEHRAHPGEIRLRVTSSPTGATATLDGKRLGRTPLEIWIPAADRAVDVELELRGFKTVTRSISLDRDYVVRASLRRDAKRAGPAGRRGKSPASSERPERPPPDLDIKEGR
jgi:serine/threonine protein kinase